MADICGRQGDGTSGDGRRIGRERNVASGQGIVALQPIRAVIQLEAVDRCGTGTGIDAIKTRRDGLAEVFAGDQAG